MGWQLPRPNRAPGGLWAVAREAEIGLLALLVCGTYFSRLAAVPIHGEEPRWAQVAYEMLQSGDWLIPRQQGEPFPDRPPLNSWCIAISSLMLNEWNAWAIRLPTALATLSTTILVYAYGRQFLSRMGALVAGAAYATGGQVLQLGRLAETDNLLTFCIASSLLVWHLGYARGWPKAATWTAGYAFTALAALTKGPQGPVYFVGGTVLYLMLRRDWRYLLCWQHAVGLLTMVGLVAAWQIPFYLALGPDCVRAVWSEEGTIHTRFQYSALTAVIKHWSKYPAEVLACLLPWSTLLVCYLVPGFRKSIGEAKSYVAYLATCLAVAFPTCWLPADSIPHYFMPLYPCLALLMGLAAERCWQSPQNAWWHPGWTRYARGMGLLFLAGAVFVAVVSRWPELSSLPLAQPPVWAVCYVLAAVASGAIVLAWSGTRNLVRTQCVTMVIAGCLGLSFVGPATNSIIAGASRTPSDIARLRQKLPAGVHLVSFTKLHHRFTYYYQELVELRDWPESSDDAADVTYFAVPQQCGKPFELPFAWEPIDVVSCDRTPRPVPVNRVIIGRRLDPPRTAVLMSADAPLRR